MAIAEIAAETKVPVASLRSIEEDRLDDLPGEVFVRGFLRAYAQCIGLDSDEILSRLGRPVPSPTLPLVPSPNLNLRRRRITSPALLFVLFLASLLILFVLWRPMTTSSLSEYVPTLPADSAG